jgi:hypothetical protein
MPALTQMPPVPPDLAGWHWELNGYRLRLVHPDAALLTDWWAVERPDKAVEQARKRHPAPPPPPVVGEVEDAPLTTGEQRDLARHEATIAGGLDTFLAVGEALAAIRDRRLYRDTHRSFAAYLAARWPQIGGRRQADRLINAAEVAADLRPVGLSLTSERQARELAPLPPEQRRVAMERATAQAGGTSPTSAQVRQAAQEVRQADAVEPPDTRPALPPGWAWRARPDGQIQAMVQGGTGMTSCSPPGEEAQAAAHAWDLYRRLGQAATVAPARTPNPAPPAAFEALRLELQAAGMLLGWQEQEARFVLPTRPAGAPWSHQYAVSWPEAQQLAAALLAEAAAAPPPPADDDTAAPEPDGWVAGFDAAGEAVVSIDSGPLPAHQADALAALAAAVRARLIVLPPGQGDALLDALAALVAPRAPAAPDEVVQ